MIEMETKSRYEVMAELENKKRDYILERDSSSLQIAQKEKQIKNAKRQIEDLEEDLDLFKKTKQERESTLTVLINSVDETLKRFQGQENKK